MNFGQEEEEEEPVVILGPATVGEHGPELVRLPVGATIKTRAQFEQDME
jgi:hypothetical protein